MKITLNDSIPEDRRPQVERMIKTLIGCSEIHWLPSRFPRLVMFVVPGPADKTEPEHGSIFDSPRTETNSIASTTAMLEEKIKNCLAK